MQMINSLVSIAVISYNQESTICECLDSLLSQKCDFHYNIIISDDSSTDATASICKTYVDRYPSIISLNINSTNLGLMRNYISTLSRCQSKYIAFCAGDDFWCDNLKLQKQVDFLESDSTFGVVRTANYIYYQNENRYEVDNSYTKEVGNILTHALYGPIGSAASVVFKRDLLDNINFNDFFRFKFSVEDYPLQALLASQTKCGFLNDVTCVFRYWDGSQSHPVNTEKKLVYKIGIANIKYFLFLKFPKYSSFSKFQYFEYFFKQKLKIVNYQLKYQDFKVYMLNDFNSLFNYSFINKIFSSRIFYFIFKYFFFK
jgi:glycosyltransferase involved in cell wall biosynthesis